MINLTFENLETGERRTIRAKLVKYLCEIEGAICYQLRGQDGTILSEDDRDKQVAIQNGVWCSIPERVWGWKDICRFNPTLA